MKTILFAYPDFRLSFRMKTVDQIMEIDGTTTTVRKIAMPVPVLQRRLVKMCRETKDLGFWGMLFSSKQYYRDYTEYGVWEDVEEAPNV